MDFGNAVQTLTLNEVIEIEDSLGVSLDDMLADGAPKGRPLRTIKWVLGRRDNPALTEEEAGESSLADLIPSDVDEDVDDPKAGQ